jgi:hypothetical protein
MLASNHDEQYRLGFRNEAGDENRTRAIRLGMSAASKPGQLPAAQRTLWLSR